jgi:serine phosphatase RsbU (regulator of sigma subunit)
MPLAGRSITVAVAARPHPEESVSGDGWSVDWWEGACRIALIDGLGHGPNAAAIAQRAVETLRDHPALGPAEALALCHRALAGTRGAAVSIARLEPDAGRLTYAGIGNVEAQLWQAGRSQRPIAYRGIVGVTARSPRAFDLALEPGWLLVLWTDGVSARFELASIPGTLHSDPHALAEMLLRDWSRLSDDATVVVAAPTTGKSTP